MGDVVRYLRENTFKNYLKPLSFLAKKVKDSDGELDLQLRKEYLNVYYKGNSLAKVSLQPNSLKIEVHQQFAMENALDKDAKKRFKDTKISKIGSYDVVNIGNHELFEKFFQDRIIDALSAKIKNVNNGEEITFEQSIITDNLHKNVGFIIIDRQVAGGGISGKLDLLGLKQMENGKYRFVVLEVKLGNNPELKNDVAGQLKRYVDAMDANFPDFKACYEKNYRQKYLLGLFPPSYPENIEIEEGVIGKILVGSYSKIARKQIDELTARHPHLKAENAIVEMFNYVSF